MKKIASLFLKISFPTKKILSLQEKDQITTLNKLLDLLALEKRMDFYFLTLLKQLNGMINSTVIQQIFNEKPDFILNHIQKIPKTHFLIMEISVSNNLTNFLEKYRKMIVHNYWNEVVKNLPKENLIQLYWLSFIVDEDETFINKSNTQLRKIMKNHILSPFYKRPIMPKEFDKLKKHINKSSLFTIENKRKILSKLNPNNKKPTESTQRVKAYQIKKKSNYITKNKLHVIKDEDFQKVYKEYGLLEQKIYYSINSIYGNEMIVKFKAFVSPSLKDAFIRESDYDSLKTRIYPNQIHGSMKYYNFKWPSTEVKKTDNTTKKEITLKDQSDLRALGYQVSTLSKEERWPILQKAVAELGLYKVAYTIASHIRRNKGTKERAQKYHRAISEWTYDLDKLKKHYYHKTFTWPKI